MELWNFECSYVKRIYLDWHYCKQQQQQKKTKKNIEYVQLDSGIRLNNVNTYPIDYWYPY